MGRLCQGSERVAAATHNLCSVCMCSYVSVYIVLSLGPPAMKQEYSVHICIGVPVNLCNSKKKMHSPIVLSVFYKFTNLQIYSNLLYCVADLLVCLAASLWSLCLFCNGSSVAPLCTASTDSCDVLGRTDIDFYR